MTMKSTRLESLLVLLLLHVTTIEAFLWGDCGGEQAIHEAKATTGQMHRFTRALNSIESEIKIFDPHNDKMIECQRELFSSSRDTYWQGTCDGGEANFVELTLDGGTTTQHFGSFHREGEICTVLPDAYGETTLRCVNQIDYGDESGPEDEEYPDFLDEDEELEGPYGRRLGTFAMAHSHSSLSHRKLYDDSGTTIDILVVWTKKAECLNSRLAPDCTFTQQTEMNMVGLAYLAVSEANAAFELSNIDTRLRLVHAYRTPDYEEPSDEFAQRTILRDLARTSDLEMSEVHDQRALYGADLVHMIVGASEACGRAFDGPNIRSAFSISNYVCSAGFYTLAHEVAHGFGADHDRGSLDLCDDKLDRYNYGYRDSNSEFRTIMASSCLVGLCDNLTKDGCDRVQRFSSNETLYNGKAIGDAQNNNVKVINDASAKIASFYPAMDCLWNDQCDDQVNATIDICDPIRRVCIFLPDKTGEDEAQPAGSACYLDSMQTFYHFVWSMITKLNFT